MMVLSNSLIQFPYCNLWYLGSKISNIKYNGFFIRVSFGQRWVRYYKKDLEAHFPKLCTFIGQKSVFLHYCIQNVKD